MYLKIIQIIIFGFLVIFLYTKNSKVYAIFETQCANTVNDCIILINDEINYTNDFNFPTGFGDYKYIYLENSTMNIHNLKMRGALGAYFVGDNYISIINDIGATSFLDIYYLRSNEKINNIDHTFNYYLPDIYLENSYFKINWLTDFDGIMLNYDSSVILHANVKAGSNSTSKSQFILDLNTGNSGAAIHYIFLKGNYQGFTFDNATNIKDKYGLEIILNNYNTIYLTNEAIFNNVHLIVDSKVDQAHQDKNVTISGVFTNSLIEVNAVFKDYFDEINLNGEFNVAGSTILLNGSNASNVYVERNIVNMNFNVIDESGSSQKSNLIFETSTEINMANSLIDGLDVLFDKSNTGTTKLIIDETMEFKNGVNFYLEAKDHILEIEGNGLDNFTGTLYLGSKQLGTNSYSQLVIIQNINHYVQTFSIDGKKDTTGAVEYLNISMDNNQYISSSQLTSINELEINNSVINLDGIFDVNVFYITRNSKITFNQGSKVTTNNMVLTDTNILINNENVDFFVINNGVSSYNSIITVTSDYFSSTPNVVLNDNSGIFINSLSDNFSMDEVGIFNNNSFFNIGKHDVDVLSYYSLNNQRNKKIDNVGLVLEIDLLNNNSGFLNVTSNNNIEVDVISVNLTNENENYYGGDYNVIHSDGNGVINSDALVIVDNPNYRAEFVVDETGSNGYVKIICVNPLSGEKCDQSFPIDETDISSDNACSIQSLNANNLQNNINNIVAENSYGDNLKDVINILNADYDNYSENMINMMPMLNTTRVLNLKEINSGYNSSFDFIGESNNKSDYYLIYDSYFNDGFHYFFNYKTLNYKDSAGCNNINKMYSSGVGAGFSYNFRIFDFFLISTGLITSFGDIQNVSSDVIDVTTNKSINYINNSGLFFNINLFFKYFVYNNYLAIELQESTIFNKLNRKINIPVIDNNNYANFTDMLLSSAFEYGIYLGVDSIDNNTLFNPFFRVEYSYYILNEYQEKGYGANYNVMKDTLNDLMVSFGLKIDYNYILDDESTLNIALKTNVDKYFNHKSTYTNVYFIDDSLKHTVNIQNPYYESIYANFGINIDYFLNKGFKLNFIYEYKFNAKFIENVFGLGVRYQLQ